MNSIKRLWEPINRQIQRPPVQKVMHDNVGVLATIIAWNALTSLVPIMVGLIAISGLMLQGNLISRATLVSKLSNALQGALSAKDIGSMVTTSTQHTGLFGVLAILGILWGGSNIGGAISTAFQPIFEVTGRNFIKEKLLDIGMIFVMAILMIIIIAATTFSALVDKLAANFPLSGASSFVVGIIIGLLAGFLLFTAIYFAFPNTEPRLKFHNVWKGAAVAAVLFEALSLVWPIYAHFSHFSRYGAVLLPILLLTAWIYFFALITVVGAEVTAITAIGEANAEHRPVGPEPQDFVPQHRYLREV
jgi:uncharacterized BrkB/YihY/UPF0761 family membrane protein